MKYNISKELFEAVTGIKIQSINELIYTYRDKHGSLIWSEINYYKLFFQCKEWALEQGYELWSYFNKDFSDCKVWFNGTIVWSLTDSEKHASEQQAVFDACMWLLENKEQK